ncbi:MAG: (2Fe-2S)-binding protein [Ectothiorhodospiraceae bacterium]|nr:(2Fe-2S)-binding protein [Ectothiorhodospiraceae bacterium]
MSGYRLPQGGVVDRARPVSYSWDGRPLLGLAGDTLASALMADGQQVLGRSFKYHRPRGVMSAGPEEGGALVTVGDGPHREPNAKATQVELVHGLTAYGQNAFPNVRFDLGRANDIFERFLAAGFYYKTFMGVGRGTRAWMLFERFIRKAAGMGSASREADPARYDVVNDYCDLLVIGAGPAGIAAAEMATSHGLDVMLVEQDFALGGSLIGSAESVEGKSAAGWLGERVAGLKGARVLTRTTAFGLYDSNVVGLYEKVTDHLPAPDPSLPRGNLRCVRPARVILATGAIERPVAFGNNDRPGVMLSRAMSTYVNRFGVAPGKRAVVCGNGDSVYADALALAMAGVQTTLLDAREAPSHELVEAAVAAGIEVHVGRLPIEIRGWNRVRGLMVGRFERDGHARPEREVACDCVGVSGGWSPAVHLLSHRGNRPIWNAEMACFLPGVLHDGVAVAGAVAGNWATGDCITAGRAAASDVVEALTGSRPRAVKAPDPGGWANPLKPLWEVKVRRRRLKSFVDPQHDVTTADVQLAVREGYVSPEHMKRYTTLGMATDQGKVGNVIGLALLADALDQTIPQTGITTFRPPYTPIPIAAFAGRARGAHYAPVRETPMHKVQDDAGARWTDVGFWKRAWYHPAHAGEALDEAYVREARCVRENVGMVDVTTLGKIQVQGPDAAEFLNRVYVNGFAKLPVMKCRYGVMLRDDGMVLDDGVTWRFGENDFMTTTTTAHAATVIAYFENLLQTRWPELRVNVASVSDQWGAVAVAGPNARKAVQAALAEGDISNEGLPFMGVIEAVLKVAGGEIPVLIARLSFSGELAYEVYARSGHSPAMWEALLARVRALGGSAYGTEALGALRIEKGHVTAAELDGRVTLEDAGLGKLASTKKHFVGNVLRKRPDLTRDDRPQLAHFHPVTEGESFSVGAIVCESGKVEGHGIGWITGVTASPALRCSCLGIGFVQGGYEAWEGREVVLADPVRGYAVKARVASPHQYDPKGERMHG